MSEYPQGLTAARALFCIALGWAIANGITALAEAFPPARTEPAPELVRVLEPSIEHSGGGVEVVKLTFEHRGTVSTCLLVLYRNDDHTWSLKC